MSHFTVLCITQTGSPSELDELLDPYDENKHLEPYTDEDGETYQHNPRAKWDWYEVGGRWSNALLLTDGRSVDSARRGLVAVQDMRDRAQVKAAEQWVRMDAACRDTPPARLPDEVLDSIEPDASKRTREVWDEYRRVMFQQPRLVALKGIDSWGTVDLLRDYQVVGREAYIARCVAQAVPGYATLTAEGWIARGDMGWFGMGTDTHESTMEYCKRANDVIDCMPAGWWLTMVDCHI